MYLQGQADEAARLCGQVLAVQPTHLDGGYLLGVIHFQQARYDEAMAVLAAVLAAHPSAPGPLLVYGLLLQYAQRPQEALSCFDRVLMVHPDLVEALNNRGNLLCDLGRFPAALADFDRALALQPDYAQGHYNRGRTLQGMNRPAEALSSYDRALRLHPGFVEALTNRGITLTILQRFNAALASLDQALAIRPHYAEALIGLGDVFREQQHSAAALASYDQALAIAPGNAIALNNRGSVLQHMRRFDQALASYDRALASRPGLAEALYNRGNLQWTEYHRLEPALDDLEKAASLNPDCDYLRGDLLHLRMHEADWRDFTPALQKITQDVRAGRRAAKPFMFQTICGKAADMRICATLYADSRYPPVTAAPVPVHRGHAKIRIGYVSGEFRAQATAFLAAGLYEQHDKSKFEIIAFDNGHGDSSPVRRRLEAAFDKLIPIADLSDDAAANRIRDEEIDILVNLNGYFGKHRMAVFARRPAPLQVNYLGFPGTLGAAYFDYILADRIVIPEDQQRHYLENVVTLPDCYQVNDCRRPVAEDTSDRAANGLPPDGFVFCSFNQGYKLTPDMFALWMQILSQTGDSVLWMLESGAKFQENLKRAAEAHGVSAARLIFAPMIAPERHLARLPLADLFLDCFPCTAHTTASDALWAGLPLVTCVGDAFASRVAASLLLAVGLPELVTQSLDAYQALAISLARNPGTLAALRKTLRRNRCVTALFDTDRSRRAIEAAYEKMWKIALRGDSPHSFAVSAEDIAG